VLQISNVMPTMLVISMALSYIRTGINLAFVSVDALPGGRPPPSARDPRPP
jgi:hypothetical protein